VTEMRTLLDSGSEEKETESGSSISGEAAVCEEAIELGVAGLICMMGLVLEVGEIGDREILYT